jgi:3-hydroxyisobutyrate dehydrogenase
MKKIGFIGLGIMGHSMAHNLLKNGYQLVVYNRTKTKAETFKELGAEVFNSPAELLAGVDICCSCVTDSSVLDSIIESSSSFPKYWIDLSTIAPAAAIKIHAVLKERGCEFIDAPVTGGDVGAKNASLSIMVGARPEVFEVALPILNCLGKNIINVGQIGSGQLTKCVNQMMCAISIAAMSEGLYFAEKQGLDIEKTLQIVRSGAAGSWALENYAPRLLKDNYAPGFYAKDQLKDLNFVIDQANKSEMSLPATVLVRELFKEFVESEGKDLGNHALIKLYREDS